MFAARAITKTMLVIAILAVIWGVGGWHIVRKPTAAQLFGCDHTYINAAGQDTGECE